MEVIPGILEYKLSDIERKIEIVRRFAKTIHVDIIDGKFAPNVTFFDPSSFERYGKDIFLEVHLMVEEPINYLENFAKAGFKRFIGHVEKMSDQVEFVAEGQILGEVGLAIDARTSIDEIKVPFGDLDFITVMTVKAGFSGQEFVSEYLKKVKSLKKDQHDITIEVDGGINDKTIVESMKAGANRFVATSFLFNSQDPQSQYEFLKSIIS